MRFSVTCMLIISVLIVNKGICGDRNFDSILDKLSQEINNEDEYQEDTYPVKSSVFIKPDRANYGVHHPATQPPKRTTTTSKSIDKEVGSTKKQITSDKQHSSKTWKVMLILFILSLSIIVIHLLIRAEFHYLPESVAVIFLGSIIGFCFQVMSHWNISDWTNEEAFSPTMFFFILLPPIIFESGYCMHKGNFFENIGSICVFAIFGTAICAFVMGSGIFLFGQMGITYAFTAKQAYAFGSLVSAVDPVATLAIFNALEIDQVLYMLVFGESILNDAVAIVLTNTIMELDASYSVVQVIGYVVGRFFLMFFASALIGVLFGLLSALLFKFIDLRRTPSLETAFMLIFMYSPYAFAEALHLSGIMAILFAGLVMSHYTHYNLSSVARITVQQIFRTFSFVAETSVFAYLGMAIFSFRHIFKPSLVILSIFMCLVSRAANIFPLSMLLNRFREHKITKKMQFIMWFSGLRGAIAFALSLNLDMELEARHVIVTTTLVLVVFTTMFLGGGTMPLMKFMNRGSDSRQKKDQPFIHFSKVKDLGDTLEAVARLEGRSGSQQQRQQLVGDASDIQFVRNRVRLKGFARLDEAILKPFFIRKFTDEELKEGQTQMKILTKQWFDEVNKEETNNENKNNEDESEDLAAREKNDSFGEFMTKTKKPKNASKKVSDNKTYHHLNSAAISSVMLDSTDEEAGSEDEQVIIDQSKFSLTTSL